MLFQVSWPSAPGGHEHRFTEYEYDEIRCGLPNACSVAASYASAGQARR
jgi:hypothetical protein